MERKKPTKIQTDHSASGVGWYAGDDGENWGEAGVAW